MTLGKLFHSLHLHFLVCNGDTDTDVLVLLDTDSLSLEKKLWYCAQQMSDKCQVPFRAGNVCLERCLEY